MDVHVGQEAGRFDRRRVQLELLLAGASQLPELRFQIDIVLMADIVPIIVYLDSVARVVGRAHPALGLLAALALLLVGDGFGGDQHVFVLS